MSHLLAEAVVGMAEACHRANLLELILFPSQHKSYLGEVQNRVVWGFESGQRPSG